MKSPLRRVFIRIISVLMLICALPMAFWCLNLINSAALDYDYARVGCFAAAIVYTFSMVTAITGLVLAGRPYRYGWCRVLGYIQLAVVVLLIFPLRSYVILTLPPLFLLTVLYLFSVGWREKRDSEQQ